MKHTHLIAAFFSLILIVSCNPTDKSETNQKNKAQIENEPPTKNAVEDAALQIDEVEFMAHVLTLASDAFEGRAPATVGGKKTVEYIEQQFKKIGLEPAFANHSYRQEVELVKMQLSNTPSLEITLPNGNKNTLQYSSDVMLNSACPIALNTLQDSELVFVGHGIVAPEYGWNDYANIDMTGKTAVILVNDPGFRAQDASLFKGNTMTYYGRWTYKYEEAVRQGAAAAIIIHEDNAAGYPWEVVSGSWSGARYSLATGKESVSNCPVESWMRKEVAQNLLANLGYKFADLVTKATKSDFKPIALNAYAQTELALSIDSSTSYNVAGVLPGTKRPDEAFIYTAHWDHIGIKHTAKGEDKIYNGAQDNATGVAALFEIAQAFRALPSAPERSVIFLAVTAEESGLLGSKYYAENPAFAMNKTVAGINIDGMSTIGASDDIVVVGYGNSEMDQYLADVVRVQGRELVPEPSPEKGYFYRSDHFNLAKKGVPMLYAEAGERIRNQTPDYGKQESARYIKERYHKPQDEIHPEWDNGGILQDMNAHFRVGEKISNSADWPKWSAGNEFKAIRENSLKK